MKYKLWVFFSKIIPTRLYLKTLFLIRQKSFLHLRRPKTLNEKIQYLKIWGYKDFHTTIADKYLVRDYIKTKIGEKFLIPCIHETPAPVEKDFEKLPHSFVMKANHGSSQVKIIYDVGKENLSDLVSLCNKWLKENHYDITKEPQYKNIKRRIIFEELLLDVNGNLPLDYKFHCISGKLEFIQVDIDRFTNHVRNFYNEKWEKLPFNWAPWKNGKEVYPLGRDIPKPQSLEEMNKIAETLAKDFGYVRIDLYNLNGAIYFGEITLHHGSGWERFNPQKFDDVYGSKLKLNS